MKRENENENENEEYYVLLLVLFVENVENVKSALELFGAAAGLERGDPRFVCILACDSSETGFRTVFRFEDNGRSPQRRQEEIAANNSPTVSHPSWTEKK